MKLADEIERLRKSSRSNDFVEFIADHGEELIRILRAADDVGQDAIALGLEIKALRDELTAAEHRASVAENALKKFRYAKAFLSADSWDGCPDCQMRFAWAEEDLSQMSENDVADIGAQFHLAALHPESQPKKRSKPGMATYCDDACTAEACSETHGRREAVSLIDGDD